MIVKYLDQSEYEMWDNFVTVSPQGYVWDYSWWISILNSNFKICALIDDDNLIVAGIVLTFSETRTVVGPKLTQSTGLLFQDMSKINNMRYQKQLTNQKEYTKQIFDFIEKDFDVFHVKFHYNYDYWLPLYWRGYKQTTCYTYIIDFKNYILDEEFKRFSKGHKWTLNKVEKKSDLKVSEVYDIEEYLLESNKTYQRQGVVRPYTDDLIKQLYRELKLRNMVKIFKIEDRNKNIHAIACYLISHDEVYYWLGASDENLRDSGGHTYLTWYAIKYFSNIVRYFNFGGSMIEHVERNFRNFGSPFRLYSYISRDKRSIITKVFSKIKNNINK